MMRKIGTITWLVLALATVGARFFLLPDTALTEVLSFGFAVVCGAATLLSLNQPAKCDCATDTAAETDARLGNVVEVDDSCKAKVVAHVPSSPR